jgi:hypothetical protein
VSKRENLWNGNFLWLGQNIVITRINLFLFQLPERPLSSLHSSFENEGFNLHSGILSPDTTIMPPVHNDFMNMTPSITPGTIGEFSFPHSFSNMPPSAIPIGRSRSTIESRSHDSRSHSRNSHSPAMSDSGISVDAGSTNSNSSAPLVNIAALAKLGTVGYSAQGMGGCSGLADLMPSAPENS